MRCSFFFRNNNWCTGWTSDLTFFLFFFSSSPSPRMSTGDVFGATTRSNIRRSHRRFAFLLFFFFFFSLLSIREIKTIIRKMVSSVEKLRGDRRFSWINNRENSFEQIRIFFFLEVKSIEFMRIRVRL